MLAIETEGLTKRFRGTLAVDALDLAVPTGTVYGFLGPNGSGKTTTIRMLLGLALPSAGTARVLGEPIPRGAFRVLPDVGALIEGPACYPFLTGRENLWRFDAAGPDGDRRSRADRVEAALARVGLTAARNKRYRAYSLGMRQRLCLAAALLRPRRLLVLDEPTNGLDPQGTREVRTLIRSLADDGTTVFLSSHLLAEVEQVCTHAAVMLAGRAVAQGTIEELRTASRRVLRVETPDEHRAAAVLDGLRGVGPALIAAGVVTADLDGAAAEDCCAALVAAGVRVRGLSADPPSLEETFVALTGEGFDVAQ